MPDLSDAPSSQIKRRRFLQLGLLATIATIPLGSSPARAEDYIFHDEFDGYLNPLWRASLPSYDHHNPQRDGVISTFVTQWAGSPQIRFETLPFAQVLRLNQLMAPLTHNGLVTQTAFKLNSFRYEVRFNTLTQGPYSLDPAQNHSIDGFIEIGLFDGVDPNRYDVASLFGNRYHLERTFQANSGIDGFGNGWHNPRNEDGSTDTGVRDGGVLADYQDNTWYKLVLTGGAGQNIAARLESDDGQLLSSWTFSHDVSAFPNGFRLSLSQYMGFPSGVFPVDVAVDYARLTGQATAANRPSLSLLSLSGVAVGSQEFTLTVLGAGFVVGSVAKWQNQALSTTVVSPNELTAIIPATLLTRVTTTNITVVNPGPPPVPSANALRFAVTASDANIRISSIPRAASYLGDSQLEIEVKNLGKKAVTGVAFDPQDQSFQPTNTTDDLRAISVQVISLPENGPQFWDGTLQPDQSVRLRIRWSLQSFRVGPVTIRGRSPQGTFTAGQVFITFPSI